MNLLFAAVFDLHRSGECGSFNGLRFDLDLFTGDRQAEKDAFGLREFDLDGLAAVQNTL